MAPEVVVVLSGLAASFLSGLLGIGGGIVLTPPLLYTPPLVRAPAGRPSPWGDGGAGKPGLRLEGHQPALVLRAFPGPRT